jgi:hypothetical protein
MAGEAIIIEVKAFAIDGIAWRGVRRVRGTTGIIGTADQYSRSKKPSANGKG